MISEFEPTQTPKPTSQLFNSPVAIILAGALIAAALYFGGGGTATPAPEAQAPAQAGAGNFRLVSDDDHIQGAANAKVTVIEYSDLECPFCKRFHPTMQQLLSEYPNDVRWVYRHFPLASLHSKAAKQAEATECAGEQGKFWEMMDKIFEVTPSNDGLDMSTLPSLAQQAGVANIPQFQACLDAGKYAEHVAADVADAQAAGGRGTPYSVIIGSGGESVPFSGAQPYAALKAAVDPLVQ